ncbi:MAG TPA: hypothetical protein VGM01_14430 [Ktedonobacteraceae bacterium]
MANTNPNTMQRNARLPRHLSNSFNTTAAPALGMQSYGVALCISPTNELVHGRIVSVSRGSPPPKKR